jgi:hypothetical protein
VTIEINLLGGELLTGPVMMLMMILLWIVADKRRASRKMKGETDHVG